MTRSKLSIRRSLIAHNIAKRCSKNDLPIPVSPCNENKYFIKKLKILEKTVKLFKRLFWLKITKRDTENNSSKVQNIS
jgi:hypothetical protein